MSAIPGEPLRRERKGTDSSESDSDSDVELSDDFFGVENIMNFLDEAENSVPVVKTRKKRGNGRWDNCIWSDILSNLTYRDPSHYNGKTFRRRFRVPYSIFEKIVSMCEEARSFEDDGIDWFSRSGKDCCNQSTIPLSLLILGCLRILGRGMCMDGVNELTNISMEAHRVFFHQFCYLFANRMFDIYCSPPSTPNEIAIVSGEYGMLGFPGCIGSVDCVHIAWDRAPHLLRWKYIGKEHYPTVAYEVACTHSRKIISCSKGFPGSNNDKTIVRFDTFVTDINENRMYEDVEFPVLNENGVEVMLKGLYLICDNGYHKWRCMQNPVKWSTDENVITFSKHLESVRKDIECCFGILKGRFRILKIPVLFQTQAAVDNIFKTCCVIHNMILSFDGLDVRWEQAVDWNGVDGHHCFQDLGRTINIKVGTEWIKRLRLRVDATLDLSRNEDRNNVVFNDVDEETCDQHTLLQAKLVTNFKNRMAKNQIAWF